MKTLYLLRHAKSAWTDLKLADHDRPLADRGEEAAATIAKYLASRKGGPPPLDAIHCSTALRAQETLARVLPAWTDSPPVTFDRGLYLCGADALMAHLNRLSDSIRSIMLVGHNPDFANLILRLCDGGDMVDLEAIREKLPTASFVAIALPDRPWSELTWRTGELQEFTTPRRLSDA